MVFEGSGWGGLKLLVWQAALAAGIRQAAEKIPDAKSRKERGANTMSAAIRSFETGMADGPFHLESQRMQALPAFLKASRKPIERPFDHFFRLNIR